MAVKYTKEQLNKLDKDFIIELFLGLQDRKSSNMGTGKQKFPHFSGD